MLEFPHRPHRPKLERPVKSLHFMDNLELGVRSTTRWPLPRRGVVIRSAIAFDTDLWISGS
jgi:hypothetical protein